jgi:hypothetical protein
MRITQNSSMKEEQSSGRNNAKGADEKVSEG